MDGAREFVLHVRRGSVAPHGRRHHRGASRPVVAVLVAALTGGATQGALLANDDPRSHLTAGRAPVAGDLHADLLPGSQDVIAALWTADEPWVSGWRQVGGGTREESSGVESPVDENRSATTAERLESGAPGDAGHGSWLAGADEPLLLEDTRGGEIAGRAAAALVVLSILCAVALFAARRLQRPTRSAEAGEESLRRLARLTLGPRSTLHLVQADRGRVLVGLEAGRIVAISPLPATFEVPAGDLEDDGAATTSREPRGSGASMGLRAREFADGAEPGDAPHGADHAAPRWTLVAPSPGSDALCEPDAPGLPGLLWARRRDAVLREVSR